MQERFGKLAERLREAADRRAGRLEERRAERLEQVLSALGSDYADVGAVSDEDVLGALAEDFSLDPVETDLLAVAAAPELDHNLSLTFDLLTGRAASGRPTVALALELLGLPSASVEAAAPLTESGRLRSEALVEVEGDGPWLTRTLRVPDRVREHLAGLDVDPLDVSAARVAALPAHGAASAELAAAIAAGATLGYVHAPTGTAGLATATAALAAAGWDALAIDVRLTPEGDLGPLLTVAAREASLRSEALVVRGAEALMSADARRALWAGLERCAAPVVAVGARPWDASLSRVAPLSVPAPLLVAAERRAIWGTALGFELPDEPGHPPLSSLRLTPEEITATADYARLVARSRETELGMQVVREAARVLGSGRADRSAPTAATTSRSTWTDLVLPPYVLGELQRLVRWASYRDDVLARGDVHGKGGKGTGLTALFTGGPGTGKTLAAHVVADELSLELMQVDLSRIVDKYVGETEKNLEKVFREAESRNVVLFFDEADALFGSRSSVQDARDRYANQEVSYLLQRMEQFDGITVLATNLRGNLDPAFSRRLQFIVHFRDPDEATRARLWRQHLERAGGTDPGDPVDVGQLATSLDLAGGDIRNVVLAAAYDAACESRPIGMRHLQEAAVREYRKLGRREPWGPEGSGSGPGE